MNRNRLRLIDTLMTLDKLPLENFSWDFSTIHDKGSCGAVGCAIGVANIILHNDPAYQGS